MKLDAKNDPAIREFENWVKDELHGERTEQSSTTQASETATKDSARGFDKCQYEYGGGVRCYIYRTCHPVGLLNHDFTEQPPTPLAGERDAAGIVSASALQPAQKIDQVYDTDLSNHLLAAVQAEHNQHAILVEQREQLLTALRQARNAAQVFRDSKYLQTAQAGLRQIVLDIDNAITTIEQSVKNAGEGK